MIRGRLHWLLAWLALAIGIQPVAAEQQEALSRLQEKYQQIDWQKYTVAEVKRKIPRKFYGNDVILMPAEALYLLPVSNLIEMRPVWRKAGIHSAQAIVVSNGIYTLERIYRMIGNPAILKRLDASTYLALRPIVVLPTATLVIENQTLRLSMPHGTFLTSFGHLYMLNSSLTSWDPAAVNIPPRKPLAESDLLKLGKQLPRPYLAIRTGGQLYASNSTFEGLGYKGQNSTFGVSLTSQRHTLGPRYSPFEGLKMNLESRPLPKGWLIGNTLSNNFFGFYSRVASRAVIVGNDFHQNVIYNIDPHDDSRHLLIARNLTYDARHAHGLIISRRVTDSILAQNLSLANAGNGIVTDRDSRNTLIADNLAMTNGLSGIALFESDHAWLMNNTLSHNQESGLYIRNSCHIRVESNTFLHNLKYGSEIAAVNLDYDKTRNFRNDPYHRKAGGSYIANFFDDNYLAALAAKGEPSVLLHRNRFENSAPRYFSGDLAPFTSQALRGNQKTGFEMRGENGC